MRRRESQPQLLTRSGPRRYGIMQQFNVRTMIRFPSMQRGSKEIFRTNREPQPKSAFEDLGNVVDEQENADGLTWMPEDAESHFGFAASRTPEQRKTKRRYVRGGKIAVASTSMR